MSVFTLRFNVHVFCDTVNNSVFVKVLECLFIHKWSPIDGMGALIISPTRELAYQIFNVLRIIGKFHDFSAGLVIGGKVRADVLICLRIEIYVYCHNILQISSRSEDTIISLHAHLDVLCDRTLKKNQVKSRAPT